MSCCNRMHINFVYNMAFGFFLRYHYVILVSEGGNLNKTMAKEYAAKSPPYILNDSQDGVMYSYAVQLVTEDGYKSRLSEVMSLVVTKGKNFDFYNSKGLQKRCV